MFTQCVCRVVALVFGLLVLAAPAFTQATSFKFDAGGGDGSISGQFPSFTLVGNSWGKHEDGQIGTYTTYSTTFSRHGVLAFEWLYTSSDENNGDFEDIYFDPAGYSLNGALIWLPYDLINEAGEWVGSVTSGSVSLDITAGDKFSWWVFSTDDCCGPATLQISAQYSVPEPGILALFALGIVGLAVVRRRA